MNQQPVKYSYKPHVLLLALLVLLAVIIVWLYSDRSAGEKPYECTNVAMGAYVQQTVYGKNGEQAAASAASAISALEGKISWREEDSDIARLNANAGVDWVTVNESTLELLSQCLDVARRSDGAFDPTILPVASLWDFGGDNQRLPQAEEIKQFLPYVDYANLRLDAAEGTASLKNTRDALDLGAVGKGAACDAAVAAYEKSGADYGVVAVGGSIGVYGTKKDKSAWKIAVRDPMKTIEEQSGEGVGAISMNSGYVSTSGSYEKYFEQDGRLYYHILDPHTGYPAESGLVSVTVTASNGALSDILSTACFVLGREKSAALLEYYDAGGIFIDKNKNVYVSPSLQNHFVLSGEGYTLCAWN